MKKVIGRIPLEIENFIDNLDETIGEFIENVSDDISESLLDELVAKQMNNMVENQDELRYGFANEIQLAWGNALDLLQGLIVICDESTQGYMKTSDKEDLVQEILVKLYAKAIVVTKEILTLLRSGFSDGAQARWRTLHELTVVTVFIAEHGEDVAERYVNHETIDIYKAAIQYNEYYTQLGLEEISNEEIQEMEISRLDLLEKYGKSYKNEYGWASNALSKANPTFRDIEA